MKNFIQRGDKLTLIAPYAVASGTGFLVGSIFAIAAYDAAIGQEVEGVREGVFSLPKVSAQAWVQGQRIYWDDTNKRVDSTPTVGIHIGSAALPATNPSSFGTVVMNDNTTQLLRGTQAAITDIVLADSTDLATAQALANNAKLKVNQILAALRTLGIIA
jgi:predicted RecA/RadA family phage recombinase